MKIVADAGTAEDELVRKGAGEALGKDRSCALTYRCKSLNSVKNLA